MKMMNKFCALMLSVALCAGMAAPAFAYGGEPVEEAEQPVLTSTTDEEDVVTVTDEETGALTDYDGVVAIVHQHIYNFIELLQLFLSRHIYLQTAERTLRHCKTDSARDKAVVSLRLLKHLIYAVKQAALTLGADCDGVALSANCKRVLRVKLPL